MKNSLLEVGPKETGVFLRDEANKVRRRINLLGDTVEFTPVMFAQSFDTQAPTALGAAGVINVTFGDPQENEFAKLGADGIIEIRKTGFYTLRITLSIARDSPAGVSTMLFRIVRLTDSGEEQRRIAYAQASNEDNTSFVQATLDNQLFFGERYAIQMAYDPSGNANGELRPFTPTGDLVAAGWTDVASAEFVAYIRGMK